MNDQISYTIDEIAKLLKVSKLTVYDLIKKGELPAYRVGRQMRVEATDLENYKNNTKIGSKKTDITTPVLSIPSSLPFRPLIISGQDTALDILSLHLEKDPGDFRPLRSYVGGLSGLMAMFREETDIVAIHLFDGETKEYNVPYVKKILTGFPLLVVNLLYRTTGIYVKKGNPKNISSWEDFIREDVMIVNREKGSGARVLLDEQLRLHGLLRKQIKGYEKEESNHLVVAAMIANGEADAGIGVERVSSMVDVDFIPMMKERYDLVILKKPENEEMIEFVLSTLRSNAFQNELKTIGGYDLSQTGTILFET